MWGSVRILRVCHSRKRPQQADSRKTVWGRDAPQAFAWGGARVSGRSLALRDGRGGRGFRGAFVLDRIKHFLAVHLDRFRRVDVRV